MEAIEANRQLVVTKRDGSVEPLRRQKILNRLTGVSGLNLSVQRLNRIVDRVVEGLPDRVKTSEIDDQLAACAANLAVEHPDYGRLASRIAFDNYCRDIPSDYEQYLCLAYEHDLIGADFYRLCMDHLPQLKQIIGSVDRIELSFFGLRTLQNGYLLRYRSGSYHRQQQQQQQQPKQQREQQQQQQQQQQQPSSQQHHHRCFEHPKFMYLRIAVQLFQSDMNNVHKFFRSLCSNCLTVASPIIFSSGSAEHSLQLASCFVLKVDSDSIDGMYRTLHKQAILMKNLGGIGLSVSNVRCRDSPVHGFNGKASGVVQYLRVVNASCQQISQGGGKRAGALAVYMEPWHGEIFDFLKMRRVDGPEEMKGRNIFYGLWIPDEFMRRVRDDADWSLMCPRASPGLDELYGDDFDQLYREYEEQGRYLQRVPARELLAEIVKSMIEMGNPYVMFKDHVNRKSNHKNIGIIRGSNLCSEICLHFNDREIAVCVLGAVVLQRSVRSQQRFDVDRPERNRDEFFADILRIQDDVDRLVSDWSVPNSPYVDAFAGVRFPHSFFSTRRCPTKYYDFANLRETTKLLVRALDNMIDINQYALEETRRSNEMNRPLGIGVQGLANLFVELKLPFESLEAKLLNRLVFEHIYSAALEASIELAIERGPYPRFAGSPMSRGEIQPVMWNAHFCTDGSQLVSWSDLIDRVIRHGLRNSTLTAIMPTATTAQLWNNNESVEPLPSVVFYRRVLSGQYVIVNANLMDELQSLGLWDTVYEDIIRAQGSVQNISCIPREIRELYKTSWEIPQKVLLDLSADRAPFIDQSQSMNVWMAEPTMQKLSAMLMYAWRRGLKTASYYLRTKPAFYASRTVLGQHHQQQLQQQQRQEQQERQQQLHRTCSSNNNNNDESPECASCSV